MASYQHMLRELRAKHAIERELAREEYELGLTTHQRTNPVKLQAHWYDRGIGKFIYATGIVIGLFFQGLALLLRGMIDIYRAKPISDGSTRKQYKGIVGQIDELESSPFITTNAIVRKKRRR
jgi:hypothetical protein